MFSWPLMYVTDHTITCDDAFFCVLESALKAGVNIVQLREKHLDPNAKEQRAAHALALCRNYKVPLIINDDVALACLIDADGVHVGQSDMPIEDVRLKLGASKIVGLSVSNLAQATAPNTQLATYLGISPIFSTQTKTQQLAPPLGLSGLADIRTSTTLPLVAIGGIDATNAHTIFLNGGNGIAVVSAISRADNPFSATKRLLSLC